MLRPRAFTLVELLVVIAIVAILSVVVVTVLNPVELLRESRDANRVSDMSTLKNAIGFYAANGGIALGAASTSYVSLPDITATSSAGDQCQAQALLPLPNGWGYQCAASSTYQLTNGTGWIPINFNSISLGSPIGKLPVDPLNTSSTGNYYSYFVSGSSYEIVVPLESTKYGSIASTDGGLYSDLYEQGTNLALAPFDYTGGAGGGNTSGYTFDRSLTVQSSQASGTLSSFPMLFSGTYAWLEASSSGGNVQNLCIAPNGGTEPCDLIFTTDSGCTSKLNFETESYTPSTGAITDWVNVSSLTGGTIIYACYDGSAVATDQSHPASTWNSNFKAVYHFAAPTSTLQGNDSTANAYNLTFTGTALATSTAPVGAGFALSGTTYGDSAGFAWGASSPVTISFWNYATNNNFNSGFGINSYGDGSSPRVQAHVPYTDDTLYWDYGNQTGGSGRVSTSYAAHNNAWTYITLVANGSGSFQAIYFNGVLAASQAASDPPNTTGSDLSIGAWKAEAWYETGAQSEFRISNAVESPSWILTEYNNQKTPSSFYTVGSAATP